MLAELNVGKDPTEHVFATAYSGKAPGPALILECIDPHVAEVSAVGVAADGAAAPRRPRQLGDHLVALSARPERLILPP